MVKRDLYLNRISSLIDKDIIKVIVGVRRCGKSYMFNLIINELIGRGIDKDNIILINFESAKYRNVSNPRELDLFVRDLTKDIEGKIYLFFDEIQNVDEWEKSINSFRVDYDCDIYLTGSNSKLLSGELATHLAGRYMEIKMYPFSFKEYLDYKKISPNKKAFTDYLTYGGFPFLLSLESEIDKTEYLNDIFNSIFLKDIIERFSIRDTSLLTRIVDFILDSTGKIVSSKSISDYLRTKEKIKVSPKTVYNYLDYLTNACLLYKVQREDIEGKKILSINEKYYCVDQGFNQVRIGRNQLNNSKIMENIVYFELLRRGYEITIGCVGDYEIDFVCKKMGEKIYVQVTRELTSEDTIEREFRPLLMVKDNYPKYVISTDEFDMSHDGIKHMNILDFLLDDKI
ncbi:MAG: ATP-binding protein [Methanobrevibacter millerae]|uniref:ATP-binding protein n=1 Tax=Methanobrevibacter millerae TaxID=230361 RepID=A0A8T3VT46_9EURY|nr:ATP-binding protein [Methanobrevibacter thaueri]MBE6511226.1 ATP-binding protein [Methanobrevibacter millerae]